MTATVDPGLEGYLVTNRAFMAPVVERAVQSLGLAAGARVVDAGTGAGGALVPLAHAVGGTGEVLGVDLHPGVLELARQYAVAQAAEAQVSLRAGDVLEVIAELAAPQPAIDAIWASDLVWPGNFKDPGEVVRRMAAGLVPGGIVALFSSNYYQAMFLPGHSRLERKLRTASELRWGLPGGGPSHYERHVAWLVQAGLHRVAVRVFPRTAFPVHADPAARAYLQAAVWPELRESAATCGQDAGMTSAEIAEVQRLLSPDSDRYVLREPGYYLVHPTILAIGHREGPHG